MFAGAGYRVIAVTGKADQHDWLRTIGASEILPREAVSLANEAKPRPLLPARWAGALDNVGGATLEALVRGTQTGGNVALCGLVGGADYRGTVMPFILRGVGLLGITSSNTPMQVRQHLWQRLATDSAAATPRRRRAQQCHSRRCRPRSIACWPARRSAASWCLSPDPRSMTNATTLNVAHFLDRTVRLTPDRAAVICGPTRLTYKLLDVKAGMVAAGLRAKGIGRGDHVALSCPNVPDFPVVYFGILKAGATVVPLNVLLKPPEIAYPPARRRSRGLLLFRGDAGAADGGDGQGGVRRGRRVPAVHRHAADPARRRRLRAR